MATESEEKRIEEKRQRTYANRRAIMDFGMGIIYTGMGLFFPFSEKFGISSLFPTPVLSWIFAGLCLVYGGFRIYRGFKRNYFR
jgi:cation transport ATPase